MMYVFYYNEIRYTVRKDANGYWYVNPEAHGALRKAVKNKAKQMMGFNASGEIVDMTKTDVLLNELTKFTELGCWKNTLVDYPPTPVPAKDPWDNLKETTMYECDDCCCETPRTEESTKRSYLLDRLSIANEAKYQAERKHFGMEDDDAPTTVAELVQRIKDGKFTVRPQYTGENAKRISYYSEMPVFLRWRDPAVKEDDVGLTKARDVREKAHTEARDQAYIGDAKEGLAALKEFESKTFH